MGYTEDAERYWEAKIKCVAKISEKHGFPEQNVEFWKTQPAGVISLIFELENSYDDLRFSFLNQQELDNGKARRKQEGRNND